jgi:hypothetical protein
VVADRAITESVESRRCMCNLLERWRCVMRSL